MDESNQSYFRPNTDSYHDAVPVRTNVVLQPRLTKPWFCGIASENTPTPPFCRPSVGTFFYNIIVACVWESMVRLYK